MRTVLGIGNPGNQYALNRHNIGFLVLDYYATKRNIRFTPAQGDYYLANGSIGEKKLSLIKPTTYVNRSGVVAEELIDRFSLQIEDLLVVCDDVNLNLGTLRVRLAGGDGGHKGLASVIYYLNSNSFSRIRIGVGLSEEKGDLADFVLSDFDKEEINKLKPVFDKSVLLIDEFIKGGNKAMLDLNSKLSPADNNNG